MEKKYYQMQVSSCLIIVFATTLLFGTFMKVVEGLLLGGGEPHGETHEVTHGEADKKANAQP
jgi:hypothetical protein